jgi:dTDP-4-dehydrorhamnose 3,5-epimerase
MIFLPTELPGAYIIELQKLEDERGFFARSWCEREFAEHQLDSGLVQCNISFNKQAGTLRGMHYQLPPFAETKLVRCTQGAIYDIIIDLRPDSPTFLRWTGAELSAANRRMMYVPKGFAHGFLTLADESEVFYQMSEFYAPGSAAGVRWDDPLFDLRWPGPITTLSGKDQQWADATPDQFTPFAGMMV